MAPPLLNREVMRVTTPAVMVVDDDSAMRTFLETFLTERGYTPIAIDNPLEALRRFQLERPAAIILDVIMPGPMDGLDALAAFQRIDRDVPIIVISGIARTASVVRAMKLGAVDFVAKPFDDDELATPLSHALRHRRVSAPAISTRSASMANGGGMFGDSEPMAEVRDLIRRVADTDTTVLVRGESGTGKELVARALYASSLRRDKPFVKVNCAALPNDLLESELFGFERGAFTGAMQQKPGKFEFANHGTIFLDEIGDVSFPLQAKLLQVLQDGEFARLGGKQDVRVDVRVVAATNRNLERAVSDGEFREDLYFRLNVVCITLPALRERREEIPALSDHFLQKYSAQYKKPLSELTRDTMQLFMEYEWPGNVRELENLIKRAVVLCSEEPIRKEIAHRIAAARHHHAMTAAPAAQPVKAAVPAPPAAAENYSLKEVARAAARAAERELILKMLEQTRWNRKEAAEGLGISYKALLYKIKDAGLDRTDRTGEAPAR